MLILPKTRFDVSSSRPGVLAANHGVTESGQALVYTVAGAETTVKAATGASGEIFAGFSLTDQGYPTRIAAIYTVAGTGSANASVTTLPAFINGSAYVRDQTGASASTKVTVSSVGLVALTGSNVLGETYTIVYGATPTLADTLRLYGEYPRQGAIDAGAQVGLGKKGRFTTTNFDTTINFAVGDNNVTLGAGGILTKGGTGVVLDNYIVAAIPVSGSPFLTVDSLR
jgi:hypothetical protein